MIRFSWILALPWVAGAAKAQEGRKPVEIEVATAPGGAATLEVVFVDEKGEERLPEWSLGQDSGAVPVLTEKRPAVVGQALRWDLSDHASHDFSAKLVLKEGVVLVSTKVDKARAKRFRIAWPVAGSAHLSGKILEAGGPVTVAIGQKFQASVGRAGEYTWDNVYVKLWTRTDSGGAYRLPAWSWADPYSEGSVKLFGEDAKTRVYLCRSVFVDDENPADLGEQAGGTTQSIASDLLTKAGEADRDLGEYRLPHAADLTIESAAEATAHYFVRGLPWEVVQGLANVWHVAPVEMDKTQGVTLWIQCWKGKLAAGETRIRVPEGEGLLVARSEGSSNARFVKTRTGEKVQLRPSGGATLACELRADRRDEVPGVIEIGRGLQVMPRAVDGSYPGPDLLRLFRFTFDREGKLEIALPPGEYELAPERWIADHGKLQGSVERAARAKLEAKLRSTDVEPAQTLVTVRAGERTTAAFAEKEAQ